MQTAIEEYFNGLCCPPPPPVAYNFDVTGDFASMSITSETNFFSILFQNSIESSTTYTITDFTFVGNNIKCNLTTNLISIEFDSFPITEIKALGNHPNVDYITLSDTQISSFNLDIIPANTNSISISDMSFLNSFTGNLKNTIKSIYIPYNSSIPQSQMDYLANQVLNNASPLFNFWQSISSTSPSLSLQNSLTALVNGNGGYISF